MKRLSQLASLLATLAFCTAPAMAQEFLNPIVPTPTSSIVETPAMLLAEEEIAAEIGARNHNNNHVTGPGAFNSGVVNGRKFSLPTAGNGLMAPASVNNAPFPSGTYNDGFKGGQLDPTGALNHYGMYSGQQLPLTATSSVDLNVVDNPYTVSNYGVQPVPNPYGLNSVLQTTMLDGSTRVVLFKSADNGAQNFMTNGFNSW